MPAPYSEDLRTGAIAAVKRGEHKTEVSKMFHISRNTLDLWLKREAETGNCRATTNYSARMASQNYGLGTVSSIRRAAWRQDPSTTGGTMGRGCDAAKHQCCDAKVRHQSKKKTYGYKEGDEAKRQAFREQLKTKPASAIVYVDEAGIDNRDDYPYGYCPIGQRFYALKFGKRTSRVSWIEVNALSEVSSDKHCIDFAALKQGKLFAPMTFALLV